MPGKIEALAEQSMMGRDCRIVLEWMYDVQRQLDLKQASIDKRVRAVLVKPRSHSDNVIFPSPDGAFSAVRLLLIWVDDIPHQFKFSRHGPDFRAGLIVHSYRVNRDVAFPEE